MATKGGDSPVSGLTESLGVDKLVELVRVAETAERYEDMCKVLKPSQRYGFPTLFKLNP